jgi:hypothetical protein
MTWLQRPAIHYVFRKAHISGYRPAALLAGIDFRILDADELREWARDDRFGMTPQFVDDAVKRGDTCVGAVEAGKLLGYNWWSTVPTRHTDDVWVTFSPTDNYGYKGFVLPEHRGRGLYPEIAQSCGGLFLSRGIRHSVYFVSINNRSNLRVQEKLQISRAGVAGYTRVLGNVVPFRSAGARRCGFAFIAANKLER